jgi:hypothetical protein
MKKVGIMQPYFFPYIGYFSLIKHTDEFILFDPVQFIRHGWIERNRILKQNEGWLYIKVPLVKESRSTLIKDTKIDNNEDWRAKILAQLQPYKKSAPYYLAVTNLVKEAISEDFSTIVDVNYATTLAVCKYLGIHTPLEVFSRMGLDIETPHAADEWALNICKSLNDVEEYWNPPGGQEFFDKSKYDAAGISLKFQSVQLETYDQKRESFEAGLSIIDVMMFNSPEEINDMMDKYELS